MAEQNIETEEKETDVYSEKGREELVENDEITAEEEGFMEGEEEDTGDCSSCGGSIEKGKIFKKEIRGNMLLFCSESCRKEFEKKDDKTELIFGDEVPGEIEEEKSNDASGEESEEE